MRRTLTVDEMIDLASAWNRGEFVVRDDSAVTRAEVEEKGRELLDCHSGSEKKAKL